MDTGGTRSVSRSLRLVGSVLTSGRRSPGELPGRRFPRGDADGGLCEPSCSSRSFSLCAGRRWGPGGSNGNAALVVQRGGASRTRAVDDLGLLIFAATATACALRAAQKGRGRQRHSWLAVGLGLGSWTVGEVIWCYYELWRDLEQAPFPSRAEPAFLLFPVGAAAA
jgi:hypothetical protein